MERDEIINDLLRRVSELEAQRARDARTFADKLGEEVSTIDDELAVRRKEIGALFKMNAALESRIVEGYDAAVAASEAAASGPRAASNETARALVRLAQWVRRELAVLRNQNALTHCYVILDAPAHREKDPTGQLAASIAYDYFMANRIVLDDDGEDPPALEAALA